MRLKLFKKKAAPASQVANATFTVKQAQEMLDEAYAVGYNEGKRDGIAISREMAQKSLKEILWQQNQNNQNQPK